MAAALGEQDLVQAFRSFAGGARMDSRAFARCLREAGLLDDSRVKPAEADVIFSGCRSKESRKMDVEMFRQALGMIAKKLGVEEAQVLASVHSAGGLRPGVHDARAGGAGGPGRLFYDRSRYTGTHKHGGPSTVGGGMYEHDVISDKGLVNRSRVTRLRSASPPSTRAEEDLSCSLPRRGRASPRDSASERGESRESVVGPERFFYDKSTYTGTHRHGGPDTLGSGRPKMGYSDLSEVVDRGHVLDDAFHRRQRAAGGATSRESTPDGRRLPSLLGQRLGPEPGVDGEQLPKLLGGLRQAVEAGCPAQQGSEGVLGKGKPAVCAAAPVPVEPEPAEADKPSARQEAPTEAAPEGRQPGTEAVPDLSPVLRGRAFGVTREVSSPYSPVSPYSPCSPCVGGATVSYPMTARRASSLLVETAATGARASMLSASYASQPVEPSACPECAKAVGPPLQAGYPPLLGSVQGGPAYSQSYQGAPLCPVNRAVPLPRASTPLVLSARSTSVVQAPVSYTPPSVTLLREKYVTLWTSPAR